MIDETPGAGPDEPTAPETAPETPLSSSAPETFDADGSDDTGADQLDQGEQSFGADQVAEQVAHDQAQGFHGQQVDKTPNEHYTQPGVAAGLPTPENPGGDQ